MYTWFYFCIHACMCTRMRCWLADWRVSGQTPEKQTSCLPHLFASYLHNSVCSPRNHADNRSAAPQKQKYHIVKQHIGQLVVYFTALLVQICITLCLPLLVIVSGWRGLKFSGFYFCFVVMTKVVVCYCTVWLPQADQCKLANLLSTWFVIFTCSGTWHGLLKPNPSWCGRTFTHQDPWAIYNTIFGWT